MNSFATITNANRITMQKLTLSKWGKTSMGKFEARAQWVIGQPGLSNKT